VLQYCILLILWVSLSFRSVQFYNSLQLPPCIVFCRFYGKYLFQHYAVILWILWESISLCTLLYFTDSMISTSSSAVLYSGDSVSQHIFLTEMCSIDSLSQYISWTMCTCSEDSLSPLYSIVCILFILCISKASSILQVSTVSTLYFTVQYPSWLVGPQHFATDQATTGLNPYRSRKRKPCLTTLLSSYVQYNIEQ
jgi:hypothetical protein